jgi:16S rRNA (cytidine1402-2'-O)-methyltransferase
LRSLAATDPKRTIAVCRELTKRHEQVVRGSAEEVAAAFAEPPKGEITLVVGPAAKAEPADLAAAARGVAELVAAGLPRRQAAEVIARLTGLSRRRLYDMSL